MAKRKKEKKTYKYECSLTGESYILTEKAENPDELMSVASWYDMNAEMDDRPDDVKKKLGLKAEIQAEAEAAATTETQE